MGTPSLIDLTRVSAVLAALMTVGCAADNAPSSVDSGARDGSLTGAGGGAGTPGGGGSTASGGGTGSGSGGTSYPGAGGGVGSDCRSQADCGSATVTCLAPGESPGCGICQQLKAPCTVDGDCASRGAAWICELAACSCSAAKSCVQGCTDSGGCATGQFCGADHRCAANLCTPGDRSCLPNFTCGSDGHCARKTCNTDADCSGACVEGQCYPRPGTCTPPAA